MRKAALPPKAPCLTHQACCAWFRVKSAGGSVLRYFAALEEGINLYRASGTGTAGCVRRGGDDETGSLTSSNNPPLSALLKEIMSKSNKMGVVQLTILTAWST